MTFNFKTHPARTCVVTRNFIYSYYDIYPTQAKSDYIAILLHGHGDFSYGWRNVIPGLLEKKIRCIVPDLLGFGQSSKPVDVGSYKLKGMADDITDILKDAGAVEGKVGSQKFYAYTLK
jgi:pimeloyl-ACP methyl ester carboxylesterase